jgi:hypothetical protein
MASFEVDERYDVVFAVASTFFLLITQARQIDCLRSSAQALSSSGRLVLETAVPGTVALPLDARQMLVREVGSAHVKVSVIEHDQLAQTLRSQEIRWQDDGTHRMLPMIRRYAHLAELDLMAAVAGLHLVGRYAGWDLHGPYTAGQPRQVSVYQPGSAPAQDR